MSLARIEFSVSATYSLPQIGKNRRVTISKFKGITLVNIREYYEANNEMKPGKKVRTPLFRCLSPQIDMNPRESPSRLTSSRACSTQCLIWFAP